jgi:hypothetical protein
MVCVIPRYCIRADAHNSHFQLLANGRCFMVVSGVDALMIYMEPIGQLEAAVANSRFKTKIVYERIGRDFVLTFDESKRAMAIMATNNVRLNSLYPWFPHTQILTLTQGEYFLHIFECDENFGSIRAASGSPISLTAWFFDNPKAIRHICFVGGSDAHIADVCLIDENNLVRIFSIVTAQFR